MRSLRSALLAGTAVAGLAFGVVPTSGTAAPSLDEVPYMATDLAGDANAVNGQGLADIAGVDVPATATGPAQLAGADVLGARITSVHEAVTGEDGLVDNVMTGIEFRIGMAAEPAADGPPLVHRFIGAAGGCTFWMTVNTGTGLDTHGTVAINLFDTACGLPPSDDVTGNSEYVSGDWTTYRWDAESSEMVLSIDLGTGDERLTSRIQRGDYYLFDEVHNRVSTLITAPVVDELLTDGFAIIGEDIPADEQPGDGTAPAGCDRAPAAFTHDIVGFAFSPATRGDLCVGDTITFTNRDGATHNAVSVQEHFATPDLGRDQSATVELTRTGTFDYRCTIHPSMTGSFTITG